VQAFSGSRRFRTDLLPRPPCVAPLYDDRWAALVVDPTDQLAVLSDLLTRGLLSDDEYERQKAKVLER
jgi:Short C-terminal domain